MAGRTGADALGWDEQPEETAVPGVAAAAVGQRVSKARRQAGMTGRQLGDAVGLRPDQISKIESGKRRLDIGELPRVAAALGVTVRYLLGQPERKALAMAAARGRGRARCESCRTAAGQATRRTR